MRHRSRSSALALATLSLALHALAGCGGATTGRQAPPPPDEGSASGGGDPSVRVVVENESEWTLRVYALVGGTQHYLGSLQGFSEATFELPGEINLSASEFRLAARATGPISNYYSNTVLVEEGDTVRWTVLRSFVQTRATIRVL